MDKKQIKENFEKFDEILESVYDISDFLNIICSSDIVNDCANHLHILTILLNEKLEKIDDAELELKKLFIKS